MLGIVSEPTLLSLNQIAEFHSTILTLGIVSKLTLLSLNQMVGFHPTICTLGTVSKLTLLSLNQIVLFLHIISIYTLYQISIYGVFL